MFLSAALDTVAKREVRKKKNLDQDIVILHLCFSHSPGKNTDFNSLNLLQTLLV